MAAQAFFSFSVEPLLLHAASPVARARNGGRRGRPRGPSSPVRCPAGQEVSGGALSNDFDFQEGLASVQALLHQRGQKSSQEMMTTVDHLKRLCIDHYFKDEINNTMAKCMDLIQSNDLLEATLSFRLMREDGYHVSAYEVLRRFTDGNGDFSLCHSKDISGLLSLQDASQLNMGEASLYKAKEFSDKHLRSAINYLEPNLARWWINLGLAREIPAARDQVMKWYMWSMTVLQGHSFSRYRIEITKLISFVYIVDDIFDLVATQEELYLFTEAVKKWDLAACDSLPGYMALCYNALYTVTNDIADMAEKEHGSNPIDHLKKAWAMLFSGFMVEAKWLSTNQVPSSEDYLRYGVVTSGVPLVLMFIFFMLGHDVAKDGAKVTPFISCPAKILRLWDDMGSSKHKKGLMDHTKNCT